jgi:hypothetical protein
MPASPQAASTSQNAITWEELQARITPRHKIRMVLPDGSSVEGIPLAAPLDAIDMRVTRTSNKQAHPKGITTVPRSSFSVAELRSPRRAGRLIGTLVPVVIGAATAAVCASSKDEATFNGGIAIGAAIMGYGGVAGYFIGRVSDRRFETFVILPQPPRASPPH